MGVDRVEPVAVLREGVPDGVRAVPDMVGRQSQTWVRFPDVGWKVIAAHVSMVSARAIS